MRQTASDKLKKEASPHGRLREILLILSKHKIVKGISPEKLRLILEELGPTFVKLGQIMSMRHDLLPSEYCSELEKLRTDAHSMDYTEVKKQIESEYQCDLTDVFSEFSKEPLGAASIAEVHEMSDKR